MTTDWQQPVTITVVNVLVFRDGEVLLGKRKGGQAAGEYASPAGGLHHMERFEDCARRELREECGIEVTNLRFSSVANITHYPPRHVVLVTLTADWASGEPQTLEPDRCEGWDWYPLSALPEPRTRGLDECLQGYLESIPFFDAP